MNQGLLGGGPLAPLTVGPRGWPHTWGDERGGPRGWPAGRGLGVFRDAVFWIDAGLSLAPNGRVQNLGYGGPVLDAQYGSTSGADTNDPLLLPWTGTNYLHLPGLVNNSITCTAPAGTASFSAVPVDGSAPTTGAAAPGAFTFQTGGQWARVDLLDAGPTVVASFRADAFTSGGATSQTDAFAVVWTINRATSGRKSAAVVRPVWLLGTDDYMQVNDHPALSFGAGEDFTMLMVCRNWSSDATFRTVMAHRQTGSSIVGGYELTYNSTTALRGSFTRANGLGTVDAPQSINWVPGEFATVAFHRDCVRGVRLSKNNAFTAYGTGSGTSAGFYESTNPASGTVNLLIGARLVGAPSNFADIEVMGAALWRRTLTNAEIAAIVSAYGVG